MSLPRATAAPATYRVSLPDGCLTSWACRGPSLYVDTACSSSLVACASLVRACTPETVRLRSWAGQPALGSPRSGDDVADACPVGRWPLPTFAADADGYGRAEGCVVLVLKRLSEAQRDGNRSSESCAAPPSITMEPATA